MLEQRRIVDFATRALEDHAEHAGLDAKIFQARAVLVFQRRAIEFTFPAGMPSNPPHHRSGAALYYIVSGTGANTVGGTTKARGPDSLIYEPFGLVHQWGNPGGEPLTFLAFNINPDGRGGRPSRRACESTIAEDGWPQQTDDAAT